MAVPMLDLKAQYNSIKDEVLARMMGVIERQQFIMGPEIAELESAIAKVSHAKHAIACASGTDAILLPVRALNLTPGDEVIAPAFTFFATAGAIHNGGGTPVFVDIDAGTFNLDVASVEAAITPRTRAIVAVDLYGQMAPIDQLMAIASKRNIAVIEDAAQAIGARRMVDGEWRLAGEIGTCGTFSFFPSKNLGGYGDGGMITTQDDKLAERLKKLRVHGGAKQYHHEEVGYNSRLDTLQAAILLAKLPHLESWSAGRRARAERYNAAFKGFAPIKVPVVEKVSEHIFHQYTVRAERRDELSAHLKAKNIGNMIYYPVALHMQPCFAHLGYKVGQLPVTEQAMKEVISLPIYPELTDAQQDEVIAAVREFYA